MVIISVRIIWSRNFQFVEVGSSHLEKILLEILRIKS